MKTVLFFLESFHVPGILKNVDFFGPPCAIIINLWCTPALLQCLAYVQDSQKKPRPLHLTVHIFTMSELICTNFSFSLTENKNRPSWAFLFLTTFQTSSKSAAQTLFFHSQMCLTCPTFCCKTHSRRRYYSQMPEPDSCDSIFPSFNKLLLSILLSYGGMYLPPYFSRHNTIFFEKILCCGKVVTTHYFLKKILCCGKVATTQYFLKKYCVVAKLSQHNIFSKNIVLWREK